MSKPIRDSKLYRLLSLPTSREQSEKNLAAFNEELAALRTKHHIQDIVYCVSQAVENEDGTEGELYAPGHRGSSTRAALLAAVLYASMRKMLEETLDRVAGEKT